MDWFPLWNSLRIAAISTVIIFFLGILAAYYVAKLPRLVKGVLDVVLTLPLVLPPTVVGYFLLLIFGVNRPLGQLLLAQAPQPAEVGDADADGDIVVPEPGQVVFALHLSHPN